MRCDCAFKICLHIMNFRGREQKMIQKTFLMVKPNGVQRSIIGEIISRFEKKGFQLVGAKLMHISQELAETHYGEHKEKPFFGELVKFITSGPVFAMVWEGENVISEYHVKWWGKLTLKKRFLELFEVIMD